MTKCLPINILKKSKTPTYIIGKIFFLITLKKKCAFMFFCVFFKALALWADAFYKSKCWSVCVFVRLCVCLFTFEVPFNGIFAPTFCSQMSNIFKDSESLGKSNGKKWSNIWKFLFGNGLKLTYKKKFFFVDFAGYNRLIPLICGL